MVLFRRMNILTMRMKGLIIIILFNHTMGEVKKFLVCKETVVLHRWESETGKFGFIKRVDKG